MNFQDLPLTPERQTNRRAYLEHKSICDEEADVKIRNIADSVIGQSADFTTHLAFAIMAISKITDPSLVPDAIIPNVVTAKQIVSGYAQAMGAILQVRKQRDIDIESFILPHPNVGL